MDICVCHMVVACCHGNVAGMETVVAGWGRAQRGAELRLTVTEENKTAGYQGLT